MFLRLIHLKDYNNNNSSHHTEHSIILWVEGEAASIYWWIEFELKIIINRKTYDSDTMAITIKLSVEC